MKTVGFLLAAVSAVSSCLCVLFGPAICFVGALAQSWHMVIAGGIVSACGVAISCALILSLALSGSSSGRKQRACIDDRGLCGSEEEGCKLSHQRPVIWMPREAWADLSRPRLGHYVKPERRTELFIHHTVTIDTDDTPSVWETYEEVRAHMRHLQTVRPELWRSWGNVDVPYNAVAFIMGGSGGGHPRLLLSEGVGLHRVGAHAGGRNTRALGVAFAGNFETSDPWQLNHLLGGFGTPRPLSGWISDLRSHLGFVNLLKSKPPADASGDMAARSRRVWAHSDIKATACPGKYLRSRLWMI